MKSIRWRIAVPFILLAVISLGGLAWYCSRQIEAEYQKAEVERLQVETRLVADQLANEITDGHGERVDTLAGYFSRLLDVRVTVIDTDGKILGESDADMNQMESHLNRPEVKAALGGSDSWDIRFSVTLLEDRLYTASPILSNGKTIGVARLSISLNKIQAELQSFQRNLLILTLIVLGLVVVLAFWISEHTLRPIRQLTKAAEQVDAGRFAHGTILDRKDEIGTLSRALNKMSENQDRDFRLLESEQEKLYGILTAMSDGVIITDSQGIVQMVNPAAAMLFNVQEHQAIGHTLTEVLRHHSLVDLWKKSRETAEQQSLALDLGAEKISIHVVISPMSGALQDASLIIIQDLTRLRRLETIRQDFVSNVSHELRTPLAAIKSLAETLDEGALEDESVARKFLSMMTKEIDSMSMIVQELLDLSKIESGRAPLQKREISMEELLESVMDRMDHQAVRAGLTLSLQLQDPLPQINVDVDRIQQVLVNIIHNAIKFTPPEGKINICSSQKDNEVQIEVHDTGIGIPDEDLPRIFERFYKGDRARSGGGTGLGLSIAKHVIEAHGGKIWAESRVGEGSSFYFTLPVE